MMNGWHSIQKRIGKDGMMDNSLTVETLMEAIGRVVWYNGYSEIVFNWRNLPVRNGGTPHQQIVCPDDYGADGCSLEDKAQLQALWMMAVSMFGDYGTSPRYGWIENIDGFKKWCLDVTATWRSCEEYDGHKEYYTGPMY